LCLQANKLAAELAEVQMDIMQIDANMDAIDEHVRGFAAQQEELEADLERSTSMTLRERYVCET
jgi:ppGpp synthetase/RelA/SpoT-type nucleotidyltranferase